MKLSEEQISYLIFNHDHLKVNLDGFIHIKDWLDGEERGELINYLVVLKNEQLFMCEYRTNGDDYCSIGELRPCKEIKLISYELINN